jgi:hypothetical protein
VRFATEKKVLNEIFISRLKGALKNRRKKDLKRIDECDVYLWYMKHDKGTVSKWQHQYRILTIKLLGHQELADGWLRY